MKSKILFSVHLVLSLFLFFSITIITVDDILTVGEMVPWLIWNSCPFFIAPILAVLSVRFEPKISSGLRYLPLAINILTMIVAFGLYWFNDKNPDFGFLRVKEDYKAATDLVMTGKLRVNDRGFAKLPDELAHTAHTGYVYVTREKDTTTVYFLYDADTFDGFSWGYLYRSDGSEPPHPEDFHQGCCAAWRDIKPPQANWFYCEAHQEYWFPEK